MRSLLILAAVAASAAALSAPLSAQGTSAAATAGSGRGTPVRAPYHDIVWPEPPSETPRVHVGSDWFDLLAIDGVPVADIVAVARNGFGADWQRRFDEDLVEVMTRMQRAPGETVTLSLRDPTNGQTSECSNVPNTVQNRQSVWQARWIRAGRLPETTPPVRGITTGDICER